MAVPGGKSRRRASAARDSYDASTHKRQQKYIPFVAAVDLYCRLFFRVVPQRSLASVFRNIGCKLFGIGPSADRISLFCMVLRFCLWMRTVLRAVLQSLFC